MKNTTLEENIALWRERIGNASARWGGAEICAVTKTVDVDTINRAVAAGLTTLGENRVQEYLSKADRLDPAAHVHLIGRLQTNKVRQIVGRVAMVQSLDRDELAAEMSRRATAAGIVLPALIEVNIGREPQKGGVDEDELSAFVRRAAALPGIRIDGLMAVMPFVDDPEEVRPLFRRMREWFERLRDEDLPNAPMRVLSMGMSGDCIVAAEEGATMVRLGRALFGERPSKTEIQGG